MCPIELRHEVTFLKHCKRLWGGLQIRFLILEIVSGAVVRSVLPKANRSAAPTLFNVFKVFSRVALKYREVHKVIPTLIINNANKLPESLLAQFQDYAKKASDEGMATIVFVSSEGRIPHHMRGTSILSSSSVVMLTKYQRRALGQGMD